MPRPPEHTMEDYARDLTYLGRMLRRVIGERPGPKGGVPLMRTPVAYALELQHVLRIRRRVVTDTKIAAEEKDEIERYLKRVARELSEAKIDEPALEKWLRATVAKMSMLRRAV